MISMEAIKFNHNPGFATHDAFNPRRNATQFVNVPEWRRFISVNPEGRPTRLCPLRQPHHDRSFAHYERSGVGVRRSEG